MDCEEDQMCLIDAGIESMASLPIHHQLTTINLHANAISRIENLHSAHNLCHLDLSSNRIQSINGLDALTNLRTLNLSCNLISRVTGLKQLVSVVKINLSYNRITNLDGFRELQGHKYRLTYADLSGNLLVSLEEIVSCLAGCVALRTLVLEHADDGDCKNKLCTKKNYQAELFAAFPWLAVVNSSDRAGRTIQNQDMVADIPGLEQFSEYLISSSSSAVEPNVNNVQTGGVSNVFMPRLQSDSYFGRSASAATGTGMMARDASAGRTLQPTDLKYDKRLETLEKKMSQLIGQVDNDGLQASSETGRNYSAAAASYDRVESSSEMLPVSGGARSKQTHVVVAERDVSYTDESDGCTPATSKQTQKHREVRASGPASANKPSDPKQPRTVSSAKTIRKPVIVSSASTRRAQRTVTIADESVQSGAEVDDRKKRAAIESTYLELMDQMEEERQRSWKAEQAAKRIADSYKQNVQILKEEQEFRVTASQAIANLKSVLATEREARLRLETEKDELQGRLNSTAKRLEEELETRKELQLLLKDKEEMVLNSEKGQLKQQSTLIRKTQEAQMKASAINRELDLVKAQAETYKGQLHQLQELLANREHEHRRELDGRVAVGSKEFQDELSKEVEKIERKWSREKQDVVERNSVLEKKYAELEEEFRFALRAETHRFSELKSSYETLRAESKKNEQTVTSLTQKGAESASLVTDLTSLVKEQKARLAEVARGREEQVSEWRERVRQLERQVDEGRGQLVQVELLKQERTRLSAQLMAQESLVEGLKAEKRIWGEELAVQSSSLAQDRGRLEAKIETLQSEMISLRRQLDSELDTVRIKTKIIEDQNETVRRLKDTVAERDSQVKQCREESAASRRGLEEQLSVELDENKKLIEKLTRDQSRKDELKAELSSARQELEEALNRADFLSSRLKAYETVELRIEDMKNDWELRQQRVVDERDAAVAEAASLREKFATIDDAFRRQLEAKEVAHRKELDRVMEMSRREVDAARMRVTEVENEMRVLLSQTETAKRATDEKIRKFTRAFKELQQDTL